MPNYYCQGSAELVNGRGARHMSVGGQAVDAAVAEAFLAALAPAALDACLQAAEQLEHGHDAALAQHERQVEQARYHASRAERRYLAVDPDNRLVARGLEAAWEQALRDLAAAEAELTRRQAARPKPLTLQERQAILALGDDLGPVWDAPTTTDKDRKQLLRTLLEEVNITLHRDDPSPHAALMLRWKGSAISELTVPLRHHWKIPCHQPSGQEPEGELLNVTAAARQLNIAPSTLLRWLDDGFVAGEQVTPGAPWRIRLTDQLRGMLTDNAPDGWVPLGYASQALGVSRQTVLQKVKRGELNAVLTRTGRRKGLRIEVPTPQDGLF